MNVPTTLYYNYKYCTRATTTDCIKPDSALPSCLSHVNLKNVNKPRPTSFQHHHV